MTRLLSIALTLFFLSVLAASAQAASNQDCPQQVSSAVEEFLRASAALQAARSSTADQAQIDVLQQIRNSKLSLVRDEFRVATQPHCIVDAIESLRLGDSSENNRAWRSISSEALAVAKATYQQADASSGGGNTTSAISSAITSQLLSLAQTYGGLTESVQGQTATVSGNLFNLSLLLVHAGLKPCETPNDFLVATRTEATRCLPVGSLTKLNRVSFALSFPTTQSSPQVSAAGSSSSTPTTFAANYQSLNQVKLTGVILAGNAATPDALTKAYANSTSVPNVDKVVTALMAVNSSLQYNNGCEEGPAPTGMCKWVHDELKAVTDMEPLIIGASARPINDLMADYSSMLDFHSSLMKTLCPDCNSAAAAARQYRIVAALYTAQLKSLIDSLRSTVLTAEYDANFPTSQPSNSVFRVIATPSFPGVTLTLNGAVSWYNTTAPTVIPGARVLRDFQLAAEVAHTFNGSSLLISSSPTKGVASTGSLLGQSTISAAYYYQDQTSPSILNVTPGQPVSGITFTNLPSGATQVFAQRGVINLLQGKFTYIPGKSGINIPIAVTWSNRTELVTQPTWRGQIGISYDFSSIFSK